MDSNKLLNVTTLKALAGAGPALVETTSFIEECGTATPCILTAVYVQNYTAECIVV
jgi:hypothetical protein